MKRLFSSILLTAAVMMGYAQTAVTPPVDATIETWYSTLILYTPDESGQSLESNTYENEETQVAFVGNDLYIAIPNPVKEVAWVKGTTADGVTYTFANAQFITTYQYNAEESDDFYFCGYNGGKVSDFTFRYDAASNTLSLATYLLINTKSDELSYLGYYSLIEISKAEAVKEDPLEVAAEIQAKAVDYQMAATEVEYDEQGGVAGMTARTRSIKIAIDGNDVYVMGLCEIFPTSWVKGTLSEGMVTFTAGQYFGSYGSMYHFYFGGYTYETFGDMTMTYDETTGQFAGGASYMLINLSKTEAAPYEFFAGVYFNRVVEKAGTPAEPSILDYLFSESQGYGYIVLDIPTVDTEGNPMAPGKLSYKLWVDNNGTEQPFLFTQSEYKNLPGDAIFTMEIPYDYDDDYDFFRGGATLYLYQDLAKYKRVGVQTIYRGGGEEHSSEIAWTDLSTLGISTVSGTADVVSEKLFDMQGRPVAAGTKGLVLRQQRMADGTVRTVKSVAK